MTRIKLLLPLVILSAHTFLLWGQEISIDQNRVQIPVLKFKSFTPVLQFKINYTKELNVKKVLVEFEGTTNISNIGTVFLFDMGKDSTWQADRGNLVRQKALTNEHAVFTFSNPQQLKNNYFIVAVKLLDNTPLNHSISAGIKKVTFLESQPLTPSIDAKRVKQRIGVALRKGGDDGIVRYRIPGLASTNENTLLALYDVRRDRGSDLQGNIDIGVSRSTDGGNTWEPMRIALDMGEYGNLPQKFNGVSDACILVDKNSNAIYIAGCWMHGVIDSKTGRPATDLTAGSTNWNHQWRNYGSLPGFDINKTSQFLITKSIDDGKTWGDPINITKQVKSNEWHLSAPAPGSGITLDDGTLVFPTQGKDKDQIPFSNITYSKDGGQTWQAGKPSYSNTTENMIVQLSDGSIMQNMRDNRNRHEKSDSNGRAIFTTKNLGEYWEQHSTHHNALVEPVCMASIYKHTYTTINGYKKSIFLFSNPNSKYKRERMTVKVSFDEGKTWPEKYWLLLDELGLSGGYSSLTSINNNTIGILYEGSQAQMTFESIRLDELGINDAQLP
ncbi:MAG: sialidase [Flavobacteriaceae bacterium]|nr:MAG: sialidase [Flavobacteriaceae bacterium]